MNSFSFDTTTPPAIPSVVLAKLADSLVTRDEALAIHELLDRVEGLWDLAAAYHPSVARARYEGAMADLIADPGNAELRAAVDSMGSMERLLGEYEARSSKAMNERLVVMTERLGPLIEVVAERCAKALKASIPDAVDSVTQAARAYGVIVDGNFVRSSIESAIRALQRQCKGGVRDARGTLSWLGLWPHVVAKAESPR